MRRLALFPLLVAACGRQAPPAADSAAQADAAFAAVQTRGAAVMGVDQTTSTHVFEDLSDGGRIVYTANAPTDTTAIRTIRTHLRDIAVAFAAGDFSQPAAVHGRPVPGTEVMAAKRAAIRYTPTDRPDGAELRIATSDAAALAAVRDFLQFQRDDHRAAGHEGHAGAMDHAAHMRTMDARTAGEKQP
ncbi:MAG: hypothetical protein MUF53_06405 [Gemmatimonadaceae bacterium]|jgi:hypothetical protein|nr:hypothetical protein [Gemmatimonadaceae bacterium]